MGCKFSQNEAAPGTTAAVAEATAAATDGPPVAKVAPGTTEAAAVKVETAATPAKAADAPTAKSGDFKVMVFAFMRNTHEGVRGWLTTANEDAAAAAATGDTRDGALCTKAQESLDVLLRLIAVHMEQEEKVFFDVLDADFDGVAKSEGLRDEHVEDLEMQAKLTAAAAKIGDADSTSADRDAFAESMSAFAEHHVKHLEHEEKIMMPLMSKIEPASRRPGIVHDILTCNWDAHKDLLVQRVVEQMAVRNPYGSLRMFIAAVQRCLTAEQYAYVLPGMKEAAGDVWIKLAAHGLDGPGLFVENA